MAYIVAAGTMVALILGSAVGIAYGQESTLERLKTSTPTIKRWGGWVLIAVGFWFVLLAMFATTFAQLFPV